MTVFGVVSHKYTEWMGRKYTLPQLAEKLEQTGQMVYGRMQSARNNDRNQKSARHIIGIERWSQSRVRVALGAPLTMDEYDDYRPAVGLDMDALAQAFAQTRQETIQLVQELQAANVPPTQTVRHNELGDLTVRGWLAYMENHAWRESFIIR